ncbi:MAG: hypothetical protein ACOY6E_12745 [Pseudomonadota bacterium]
MLVNIHAFDEYNKTNRGRRARVSGKASFSFERDKDGKVSLILDADDCEMKGTGERGGDLGKSVKFINRTAKVTLLCDEVLALYRALQKELEHHPRQERP